MIVPDTIHHEDLVVIPIAFCTPFLVQGGTTNVTFHLPVLVTHHIISVVGVPNRNKCANLAKNALLMYIKVHLTFKRRP